MLYFTQSPYYQWFLSSAKKQRVKQEAQYMSKQDKPAQNNPKPFTE